MKPSLYSPQHKIVSVRIVGEAPHDIVATADDGTLWVMNFPLGSVVAPHFVAGVMRRGWVDESAWKRKKPDAS